MGADHLLTTALAGLAALLAVASAATGAERARGRARPLFRAALTLDLGEDVGQGFGTLFEARDGNGRPVLGAGFVSAYNTLFRADRYQLQFYVRPRPDFDRLTIEQLPRPSHVASAYLFSLDGRLYCRTYDVDRTLRVWNEAGRRWEEHPLLDPATARFGDGAMRVGRGLLRFMDSRATYGGREILAPPAQGWYHNFFYANGHLLFYHTHPAAEGGFTRVLACPWRPDREAPIDVAQAIAQPTRYTGETPFALGQLGGQLVTCSNNGGFYAFDGRRWQVLREADRQVSYQIYAMLNHYDRLLMGQYPSGHLFAYDGSAITPLPGWPPVPPGVAGSVREAQTATLYRGEVWVGVWPWAELWRHDGDAWIPMGRAFTRPEPSDRIQHPYEEEIRAFNQAHGTDIVLNLWGQRVASMVPLGDSLVVSTSAKGPAARDGRLGFLTDEVYAEYGQVLRLRLPGNLSVNAKPTAGPTRLECAVYADRMVVLQDGVELGSAVLPPGAAASLKPATITWGYGAFGPLAGRLSRREVAPGLPASPGPKRPPGGARS